MGIDVGYSSLGLVCVETCENYEEIYVEYVEKIDLRDIPCTESCILKHSSDVVDRISHFIQHYQVRFDKADLILVERQPPGGLKDVQALLFSHFRHKCSLVSPNTMHRHFNLPMGEYEKRKEMTVELARPHMNHLHNFNKLRRQHDVADAFCMVLMTIQQRSKAVQKHRPLSTQAIDLNRFRFVKS